MKSQIRVGIIGFGNIGWGTAKVLMDNAAEIERKVGSRVELVKIADLDITTPRPITVDSGILTTDANEILNDPEIDIVVELIGGVNPAKKFILQALRNGKHVVTANKELIAKHGPEIFNLAAERGVDFYFEGSVGGGIPIIGPLKTGLAANNVQEIMGIVNGTTNYILTKMANDGRDFDDVLAEAQKAGYAEADPTSDIEGYDAKYKIAILASIAYTCQVNVDDIHAEGITKISRADMENAHELGYVIKLLAIAKYNDGKVQIRVHPTLIPAKHPLASVNDVFNAIFVRGDFVGDVMFYGRGAGSHPTGSAVAGDIMDIARNINRCCTGRVPQLDFGPCVVQSMDEVVTKYYLRMRVADRPGVLANISGVFGHHGVSLASVMQKDQVGDQAEIVMVTHTVAEANFRQAIQEIARLPVVSDVCMWIRVEE
jgi:homoserine dehydrogenase